MKRIDNVIQNSMQHISKRFKNGYLDGWKVQDVT